MDSGSLQDRNAINVGQSNFGGFLLDTKCYPTRGLDFLVRLGSFRFRENQDLKRNCEKHILVKAPLLSVTSVDQFHNHAGSRQSHEQRFLEEQHTSPYKAIRFHFPSDPLVSLASPVQVNFGKEVLRGSRKVRCFREAAFAREPNTP